MKCTKLILPLDALVFFLLSPLAFPFYLVSLFPLLPVPALRNHD